MKPIIAVACNLEENSGRQKLTLNRPYAESLLDAGSLPLILPLTLDTAALREWLSQSRGLFLPGGIDVHPLSYGAQPQPCLGHMEPELDQYQSALITLAMELRLPILAICRGLQILNTTLGGTLIQHIPGQAPWINHLQDMAPRWSHHSVTALPGSRIETIFGSSFQVNSFHHQAVDRPAPELAVTATASDGIIEALEHRQRPFVVGVQWHPEGMAPHCPAARELFRCFTAACEKGE